MGKTTGFMYYTRKTSSDVPPLDRIENFNEIHISLPREAQPAGGESGDNRKTGRNAP